MTMKTLPFGVEVETVGKGKLEVAEMIQSVVGGEIVDIYTCTGPGYGINATDGRQWKSVRDGSIDLPVHSEVVTPIMNWDDISLIQKVIRRIRRGGAKVNSSCGIHIHIDGSRFCHLSLVNLANLVHNNEDLLIESVDAKWRLEETISCRKMDEGFFEKINRRNVRHIDDVNRAWFGGVRLTRPRPYHNSRYRGLNFHSFWYKGTVEFRYFRSTLHAGEVKSYIHLCLSLAATALTGQKVSRRQVNYNFPWSFFGSILSQTHSPNQPKAF